MEKIYKKIEVIACDLGDEKKDLCMVVTYPKEGCEGGEVVFLPVSFRTPAMAQLLKELHNDFGVMPEFKLNKII